jgi:hypothetical protein
MTSISDLAEKLGKEAESIKLYFSAIESRVVLGASIDGTMMILDEKVRTFNKGFEELTELVQSESED